MRKALAAVACLLVAGNLARAGSVHITGGGEDFAFRAVGVTVTSYGMQGSGKLTTADGTVHVVIHTFFVSTVTGAVVGYGTVANSSDPNITS